MSRRIALLALMGTGLLASAAAAQWTFETIDSTIQSRGAVYVAVPSDGTVIAMYSGNTDGMSCDGTADVHIRVRVGPNNWIEPPCVYTPSRLRVTRPHMTVDAAGNIYVVYEHWWAYYTGLMKFVRTGPTTWARDGGPILIRSPGITPCGTTDPNLPSNHWVYGYNPRIEVAPNGSIHVLVNPNVGGVATCIYCYNSGVDWKNNWQVPARYSYMAGERMAADANGDVHLLMTTVDPGGDPNLANNAYVKIHNGVPSFSPLIINDGGARTGEGSIGLLNSTAYITSMEWNLGGNGVWNQYYWTVNGTLVSNPVLVHSGGCCPRVAARNNSIRYFWRVDATDARWAWYMTRVGHYSERVSLPGHDTGDMHPVMDANNNLHVGISDWDPVLGSAYVYGYRPTDEPPPNTPHGVLTGVVQDNFGAAVANVAVQTQNGVITATTDAGGVYSMDVPAGAYTLTAIKAFYSSQTSGSVFVADGQAVVVNLAITGQPPAPANSISVITGNTANTVRWTNPTSSQYSGTRIVVKMTGFPAGPTDGTVLIDDAAAAGTTRTYTHTGLTNGVKYYYAAFAYFQDASKFFSTAVTASGAPAVRPDFDHDGDTDMEDFGLLQRCLTGPVVFSYDPVCDPADLNSDRHVDSTDLGTFMNCFTGPGGYASPDCAG